MNDTEKVLRDFYAKAAAAGVAAIAEAVEKERERCAKVCDEMEKGADGTDCCKWPTPSDCAYAIRKGE